MMPKGSQNETWGSFISLIDNGSSSLSSSSEQAKVSVSGTNLSSLQVSLSTIWKKTLFKFRSHRSQMRKAKKKTLPTSQFGGHFRWLTFYTALDLVQDIGGRLEGPQRTEFKQENKNCVSAASKLRSHQRSLNDVYKTFWDVASCSGFSHWRTLLRLTLSDPPLWKSRITTNSKMLWLLYGNLLLEPRKQRRNIRKSQKSRQRRSNE